MKDGILECILEYGYRDERCKIECSEYYKGCGNLVKKIHKKMETKTPRRKKNMCGKISQKIF